jgi:ferredoxin
MTRQFNVPAADKTSGGAAAPSPKPVVDPDACTSCEACVSVCPEAAIEMRGEKAFILPDQCSDCRACVPACPAEAIG